MSGGEIHSRSIVVWDVPSAIECGQAFTVKIGLKCAAQCTAESWPVEVRDQSGVKLAHASVGEQCAAGTDSLRYAEIELEAPDSPGLFAWMAVAPGASSDTGAVSHTEASTGLRVRTVAEAECRLTVIAVDRSTQQPLRGVKVVVHPYRTMTDDEGRAELALPRGRYRLFVSGREMFPFRSDGELAADTTIRAELEQNLGPSDAELWS